MKKYNSIAHVIAGMLALFAMTGLAVGADFTGSPINVPIRYSGMESNVPDAATLSFGDDQDVSFSYDTATGGIVVDGATGYAGLSTNTSSALVLDYSPDISSLKAGQIVSFIAHTDCNDGATLNVDGLGAKAIYEVSDGTAVEAGDITSGTPVLLIYYNSLWYQLSQSGN